MKRKELTPIDLECNMGPDVNGVVQREPWKAYDIDEVDTLLDKKNSEINELRDECQELHNRVSTLLSQIRIRDERIDELDAKLESVQATDYADSVDAGMRERRLIRALWLARAEWARSSALSYHLIEDHPDKDAAATYKRKANKWEKVKDKCLKKAELYK